MSLYPKQLNGLKDLQLEKQLLKQTRKEITLKNIFTEELNELRSNIPGKGIGGILGLAVSALSSETVINFIIESIPSLSKLSIAKKIKKSATSAAGTILGGFAKWEAIELAVRGIGLLIRMRKRKKEEAKQS